MQCSVVPSSYFSHSFNKIQFSSISKAEVILVSDHDMVQNTNPQYATRSGQSFGALSVFQTRARIPGWVVVQENDGRGAVLHGGAKCFTRMHNGGTE